MHNNCCLLQTQFPQKLLGRYYCLATAAALLKYVEHIQNTVYAPGSLDVAFSNGLNVMMMGACMAVKLEEREVLRIVLVLGNQIRTNCPDDMCVYCCKTDGWEKGACHGH